MGHESLVSIQQENSTFKTQDSWKEERTKKHNTALGAARDAVFLLPHVLSCESDALPKLFVKENGEEIDPGASRLSLESLDMNRFLTPCH